MTLSNPLGSPLDILGGSKGSHDLLAEVLDAPKQQGGFARRGDFNSVKEELRGRLTPGDDKPIVQDVGFDLPDTGAPIPDLQPPHVAEPKPADKPDMDMDQFHRFNSALDTERQRVEALQQSIDERERRQQAHLAQSLEEIKRSVAPQPKRQEVDYEALGFDSLEQYEGWSGHFEREVNSRVDAKLGPILRQAAADRFGAALSEVSKNEHFDKYFKKEVLMNHYNGAVQQYGLEQISNVNWGQELSNMYAVADAPRKEAELKRLQDRIKELEGGTAKKSEAKGDLRLVPKANQQGAPAAPATSSTLQAHMKALPQKMSITAFGAEMKKAMGYRQH